MKKKNLIVLAVALALVFTTAVVIGSGYEPGSAEDPIVTKSYVDDKIAGLLASLGGEEGGGSFTPVNIGPGKKMIGGEGTEIILRSGRARAVAKGTDGLSDVTIGSDIAGGKDVSKNHLLLIPRADGRGIEAVTDIWVMVKGVYTVE